MKTNKKAVDTRSNAEVRLAGGFGAPSANQESEALLRRSVMASLLFEGLFYEDGVANAENVKALIPQVDPVAVSKIAIEARHEQKLRHMPLFIVNEMVKHPSHRKLVGDTLYQVINRADEMAEFLAMYWSDGKKPLAKQVKVGLAKAFGKFDEYKFAKYKGDGDTISLRDVMFMVHPKPLQGQEDLYKRIAEGKLKQFDTWEDEMSAGKNKDEVFTRLINEGKLGALAFLRNLRKMQESGVPESVIRKGFETVNPKWLLPLNYLAAAKYAPRYEREIESLMKRGYSQAKKLPGYTVFVVDVSGSMSASVSSKSEYSRLDVASAMAMLAAESCERVAIYATAGSDGMGVHKTEIVPNRRGFGLIEAIKSAERKMGGGGIFTRQCLNYIKGNETSTPDRIIVFSDSQDCDRSRQLPQPFGKNNYIVDVSAHEHGINYKGVWTREISGWSEHFLDYIAASEGIHWTQDE